MATAHYFLEGSLRGTSTVKEEARSIAFFCPEPGCGRIWAAVVVSSNRGWDVQENACEQHPRNTLRYTHGMKPGSLVPTVVAFAGECYAWNALELLVLPRELLERELRIELKD